LAIKGFRDWLAGWLAAILKYSRSPLVCDDNAAAKLNQDRGKSPLFPNNPAPIPSFFPLLKGLFPGGHWYA
jgi:hypothetical protein